MILSVYRIWFRGNRSFKPHRLCHNKAESAKVKFHHLLWKNTSNEEARTQNIWPWYNFTGSLRPAYVSTSKRYVPPQIQRPDYADHPKGYPLGEIEAKQSTEIKILTEEEIENMRIVCRLSRECLDIGARAVHPGVTTDEIDKIIHEAAIKRNCYPSTLNYYNFPKSCCTSINEVICHGIPDQRKLQDGDIINIDVTCYYNGFHGDLSETIFVGNVDDESKSLVKTAYDCLMIAIAEVKPGARYYDLGHCIEKEAIANGCSVTKTYCGHGINSLFHTAPSVPHHANNTAVDVMKPGHVFTIEPMINKGVSMDTVWPDNWTVVTMDGKRSAQFEHTVVVTETGVDILTKPITNNGPYFIRQLNGESL